MDGITVPCVEVSGPARERGRQYGEAARAQIEKSIEFYQQLFAHTTQLSWSEIQERVGLWVPLIEAYLPDSLEEIRGIAEGSGRKYEEILALNGRGELASGYHFSDEKEGCSSFAMTAEASGDGHVYCGQNWDWLEEIVDTLVMLRIHQPPKPTIITQVEAGQIGRQGVNSAGIGLFANGLGARFGKNIGLPQPYIRRRVLDSANMNEALKAVFNSKQSSCSNLLLTHREGFVIDLETTPARHGWMYPTDGLLVHANHFIAFIPPQVADSYRPYGVDSLYRVERIERVLKRAKDAQTSEEMRELIITALGDHFGKPMSVCCHADKTEDRYDQYQTIASSIVDLTTGDYYIAPGTPCTTDYQKLPWNIYDDGRSAQ